MNKKLNQVLALLLTIAALGVGQTAWAQDPATIGSISYNSALAAYEIANENNLKDLAVYVNGSGSYTTGGDAETTAHDCTGLTFKVTAPIALTHTTDWDDANSTEDTYTPIGNNSHPFKGTFDGQNKTISCLRIYKTSGNDLGLFGYVGEGGTVKDVNLSDVRISGGLRLGVVGYNSLGTVSGCHISNAFIEGEGSLAGIVGENTGTVSDCHVSSTVTINTNTNNAQYLGGIVGYMGGKNGARSISGCISSATLTIKDGVTGCKYFGGIVGNTSGDNSYSSTPSITDCFAMSVTVPATDSYSGAIAGFIKYTTFTGDYYYNCTVAGTVNVTNKAYGSAGNGNTGQSTMKSLHIITFGPGLSGSGGIVVDGDTYYAAGSTVTLSGSTNGYTVTKDGTNPAENVTVNESGGVYTFTMPTQNVTVSGPPDYAGLWNEDGDHDGSSEAKAYIIRTPAGLQLLADVVNAGNSQSGKFFKLEGNIEFTYNKAWNDATSNENNYTPIGNGSHSFSGIFDGQGNTISGIRIYREGKNYTGLFGDLNGGTVKNVRLADARITGSSNIGGIAGYNSQGTVMNCTVASNVCIHAAGENHGGIVGKNTSNNQNNPAIVTTCTSSAQLTVATGASGTPIRGGIVGINSMSYAEVSNCLVLGASVLGWGDSENCKYLGAIVGNNNSGTLSNNYYSNCTVGNGTTTANTNVGVGSTSGPGDVTTDDGARGIGTITLGDRVSKTGGTTVTVGSTEYYYAGSVITLSHSDRDGCVFDGYTAKDAADNDITATAISGSTLTMPAGDVTATANWKVPYIDVDGNTAYCTDFTELTGGDATSLDAGWYVVNSNISYTDRVTLDGDVTIILCDGKTMNIGTEGARLHHICIYGYQKSLTIYGQSGQTGALKTYSTSSSGINVSNYAQHGGNVTANATASNAVSLSGGALNFSLSRGTLAATATGISMFAISLSGTGHSVNMSGGTLTATSSNSIAIRGDVNFTGGNLTATGGGSYNGISGNVTLSWSSLDDSFTCSKYLSNKSVTIANGKAFSNGEEVLRGTINSSDYATKLDGKALTPVIEGTCGNPSSDNVTWTYLASSHTLTISGTGAMKSYDSADDQPWKSCRSSITSVVIGNGVTSIGSYAFSNCTNLTSVTVYAPPTCVLADHAFDGCDHLANIYVFSGLVDTYKTTGSWSHYDGKITEMTNPNGTCGKNIASDVRWVLTGTSTNYTLTIMKVGNTGDMTNYSLPEDQPWNSNAGNIKSVVIENGVTSIGRSTFGGSGLTSITIPASVTSIGEGAFSGCTSLTSVNIPANLTSISEWAFSGTGLTSVTIPDNVESIGSDAFDGCASLATVTIGKGVTSIGDGVFANCSKLATITVDGDNTIYDSRDNCNAIIKKSSIELVAGCKSTIIPNTVKSISYQAFEGCTGLTSIAIPASVQSIGSSAFKSCSGLTSIAIPASVTSIGNYVFPNCTNLATVTLNGPATIGAGAFLTDANTTVAIANGLCLYNGTDVLYGNVTDMSKLNGKSLTTYGITVTANQNGSDYWTTFYDGGVGYSVGNDVTIYKAAKNGTSSVTLTEVSSGIIPAGQAVVLKATASPVVLALTQDAATGDYSGNELLGVDAETAQASGKTYYVLSKKDPNGLGFYKLKNTVNLGAHKAYLEVATTNAPEFLGFEENGEATGISLTPDPSPKGEGSDYYTLDGRKLQGMPTQKGMYIHNGHKVVIK